MSRWCAAASDTTSSAWVTKCFEAADGSEAVRTVRHYRGSIDLLVVDIVLPGAPGPAVVREIQKSPSPVGVVYISAYPTSKLLAERRVKPTDICLQKPFDAEALASGMDQALARAAR